MGELLRRKKFAGLGKGAPLGVIQRPAGFEVSEIDFI